VFSDPVNFIDPNGKFAWNVISGAFGALLGGLDAAGQANATFGSIMSGIAIGGATGFIGLNPTTTNLLKIGLVAGVNFLGDIANQLNKNSTNLDYSKAVIASIVGVTGGIKIFDKYLKTDSEILKHIKELINQLINGELVEFERCVGK